TPQMFNSMHVFSFLPFRHQFAITLFICPIGGPTLKEAFEQVVICMFGYITELDRVDIDEECQVEVEAEGHDLESLLFSYMDEFLFQFNTEFIICKQVQILEFDAKDFRIKAIG